VNEPSINQEAIDNPGRQEWFVYILRCADGSLYTGVTTDPVRRLKEHNSTTKGARYTRSRRPVRLVHAEPAASRSTACRREYQLKQLSKADKERVISCKKTTSPSAAK